MPRVQSGVVSDGPSVRSVMRVVTVVVTTALTLYLIFVLRKPITWIVIAAFIAVALSAPVGYLENKVKRRGTAIMIVYLGLIMVPVAIGGVLVPPLVKESNKLIDRLPSYASDVTDYVQKNKTLRKLEADYNITEKLQQQAEKLPSKIGVAAGVLSDIGFGIVNSLFALITILILSAFMIGSGGQWITAAIRSRPHAEHEMLERAALDISAA